MTHPLHVKRPIKKHERYCVVAMLFFPLLAASYTLFSGMIFHVALFTWGVFALTYALTAFGLTIGYHRLTTHDSFQTPLPVKYTLLALGCMTLAGPPIFWVAAHRRHHKFSDHVGDPHSPRLLRNLVENFFHAQGGWLLHHQREDWNYYASDLCKDNGVLWIQRYYLAFVLLGILVPAVINGLYFMRFYHFFEGIMVCGFLRIAIAQHLAWAVNSVCHLWGRRDFSTADNSRNNAFLGILALGDGWHNGHHAFPRSARHGLIWWQLDISYGVICLLGLLGLAKNISKPSRQAVQKLRLSHE